MKLFKLSKDGGPKSRVWGYWLIEAKRLFSICLLHFKDGSRESYHSHAFNSVSWLILGQLTEEHLDGKVEIHKPSFKPIRTKRDTFHKVSSRKNSFVLTFRGPWADKWSEYDPNHDKFTDLTHGRKVVGSTA